MLEQRVQGLEQELEAVKKRLARLEPQQGGQAPRVARPATVIPPARARRAQPPSGESRPAPAQSPPAAPRPWRPAVDLEDLLGGRVLAWLGGVAVAIGLAFLMALAISNGWIGEGARTVIAVAASAVLIAVGIWLHEHKGRTHQPLGDFFSFAHRLILLVEPPGCDRVPGDLTIPARDRRVGARASALPDAEPLGRRAAPRGLE